MNGLIKTKYGHCVNSHLPESTSDYQTQSLNVLREDIVLPAAVIHEDKLSNNLRWMQNYTEKHGVNLAPHGKTTMTPYLFHRQIEAGAWGITLATIEQVYVAYQHGIKRILLANQINGLGNLTLLSNILRDSEVEFYCLVDSITNVEQLQQYFAKQNQVLHLLVEIRPENGRSGCSTLEEAIDVADAITSSSNLRFVGLEFYEGTLSTKSEVDRFLKRTFDIFTHFYNTRAFSTDKVLFSGAGSVWFDRVASIFSDHKLLGVSYLIRPGCYIIHDQGIYQVAQNELLERDQTARNMTSQLQSSLEVWAYVLSTPKNTETAIVGMGKRDVAFDAGLPKPVKWYRKGWRQARELTFTDSVKIMDQHTKLKLSSQEPLQPGDLIGFATSHPCLTFDKWRSLYLVDENMTVIKRLPTYFRMEDLSA